MWDGMLLATLWIASDDDRLLWLSAGVGNEARELLVTDPRGVATVGVADGMGSLKCSLNHLSNELRDSNTC